MDRSRRRCCVAQLKLQTDLCRGSLGWEVTLCQVTQEPSLGKWPWHRNWDQSHFQARVNHAAAEITLPDGDIPSWPDSTIAIEFVMRTMNSAFPGILPERW